MNKYQKALDELCNHTMECVTYYGSEGFEYCYEPLANLEELRKPLQELVDLATPKKPKVQTLYVEYQEPETFVVCPICEEEFYYDDCEKINHCPNCGQVLDWSEEIMNDEYDYCYECQGYGDNYFINDDGELECYCFQCCYWGDGDE